MELSVPVLTVLSIVDCMELSVPVLTVLSIVDCMELSVPVLMVLSRFCLAQQQVLSQLLCYFKSLTIVQTEIAA